MPREESTADGSIQCVLISASRLLSPFGCLHGLLDFKAQEKLWMPHP